jgi:mediator of RNA polymerase II transcription subunit 5
MTSLQTWQTFFARSLATRLEPSDFESYVQILSTKHPLSASRISDLFLRPTEYNSVSLDPRVVRYVQVLLGLELVTVPSVLRALWKVSSFRDQDGLQNGQEKDAAGREDGEKVGGKGKEDGKRWNNSYIAEETLFYRLTKYISSGIAPHDTQEAVELVMACVQWMRTVISVQHVAQEMLGLTQTHTAEMNAQNMALGTLIVAVVENGRVLHALSKGSVPKPVRKELKDTLTNFVPLLLQSSPQSAARLEVFRTQTILAIEPVDKKERAANKEIEEILEEGMTLGVESMVVADMPTMNSRAGLYVYLNSLVSTLFKITEGYLLTSWQLVGRPLIEDHAMFAYLHNRYQVITLFLIGAALLREKGDIQSTIIDVILAAFDILANATFRNERPQSITILRSFLINKIPLLLATLSPSLFPPLTSEYCITEALSHVDTNAFPTLSGMFDESSTNNMFSDSVRQDFCFACCLHGLIEESSIETLLGDIPMQSLPAGGRYMKDDLVQQCLSDPERTEGLIDELEHMDGNVGAVSQAITEVCNTVVFKL